MCSELNPGLFTAAGQALLASLPPYSALDADVLSRKLRAHGMPAPLVASALTQSRLRAAAVPKFGSFAARMLFTEAGLQQATRLEVAAHHAKRFREAGCTHIADLGCGLGGDSLALASLDLQVTAVEQDTATAACATVNLTPLPRVRVLHADATTLDLASLGVDGIFADPARRSGSSRLSRPEDWAPSLDTVLGWRRTVPALGVKVAPGIDLNLLPPDSLVQWASVGGEVVEAMIWCGPLAPHPGRSALVIDNQSTARVLTDPTNRDPSLEHTQVEAGPLGRYIFEPDGAVIRAGMVAYLAEQLTAHPVSDKIAYLTGDTLPPSHLRPFLHTYRVQEVLPLQNATLKKWVRDNAIGELEIKKRGADIDPSSLREALRPRGQNRVTLIATRLQGRHRAVIVQPETDPA
ncbi:class I SAM-dependent methyltransferase [Buchananella hordeovulneris]|uniref:class I SAM-dependent methyltransferase n=1 Tax=Buchananella hordeovulneris TaxID=52770 RepID=UPI000F5DA1DB|nr:class I SAM-dependent methyltransferase [Buchananella hordeovulneris]RRD52216.1 class I SAM-dependent methyltransferase [Buchananella hordeovulneris]